MEPFVERRVDVHNCTAHPQYEGMILDLKETAKSLVEGQMELKMTMIQLTENLKGLDRLEDRMNRLESKHAVDDKTQDDKIGELQRFMYKAVGAVTIISATVPWIVKGIMAIVL